MKPALIFLSCIAFLRLGAQNVFTVNNMPGTASTHKTLQGAVDSAANGSIIYVEPSSQSYGVVNLNKPVTLIGSGYFLGLNPEPFTQANLASSILTTLNVSTGAEGSIITGLNFSGTFSNSNVRLNLNDVSDISFVRCYFAWDYIWPNQTTLNCAYLQNTSSITFRQCYFDCPGQGYVAAPNGVSNILYENNIMTGNVLYLVSPWGAGLAPNSITYRHNTFVTRQAEMNFGGSQFFSNIILMDNSGGPNTGAGASAATNNVSNKAIFGAGNITNATIENVLLFSSNAQILSPDGRMQLKAGSPAAGYGEGGTDAGAFGGTEPYVLSGIPFVPNIYAIQVMQNATSTGGLKLQLKVKANH